MPNFTILVSIIMNCHNGEKYLHESISSVINQTYENWELIFWDNCSTDNSKSIIESINDNRIKYFHSKKFTSLGQARNLAISKARGDFIAFIDTDDLWMKNKIEKQLPLFENDKVGIVISNTIFFKENGWKKILYKSPPITGNVFRTLITKYFISLETVMIRRECLQNLDSLFDKRFNLIEEFDFLCRLSYQWQLDYVDEILAKWRFREDSMTWTQRSEFPSERRAMIKKLISVIPDFKNKYDREIQIFNRNTDYDEALGYFMKNEYSKSRKSISKYKFKSIKIFIFYCLSFIPIILTKYFKKKGHII